MISPSLSSFFISDEAICSIYDLSPSETLYIKCDIEIRAIGVMNYGRVLQ